MSNDGQAIFGVSDDAKFRDVQVIKKIGGAPVKSGVNTSWSRRSERRGRRRKVELRQLISRLVNTREKTHSIKEQKEGEVSEEENKREHDCLKR